MAVATGSLNKPIHTESFLAGADLSAHQYKFVKLSADNTVVICSAATDTAIGVLQNKPDTSGKEATVMVIGRSKVNADAALTFGTLIGTAADGQADAKTAGTDTTEYILGTIIRGAGSAGNFAEAVINCANPARAA